MDQQKTSLNIILHKPKWLEYLLKLVILQAYQRKDEKKRIEKKVFFLLSIALV